ncbi:MAG: sporulation protein YqfD [Oscillibacter sp.]|nr:sporulation protein YqfD [Oscillibacter sp.]
MIRDLVNRLRGQVQVRVECAFPERVMNLCATHDLRFWDLCREDEHTFTCVLHRRDYRLLRRVAPRAQASVTPLRRSGAPYFFLRLRARPVLAVGAAAVGLWLMLGTFFIWDFQVEGNETVPTETILRALERQGVGLGSFGLSLDSEDLRNRILLEIPELVWLTVNVSGCRAQVQVRERVTVPEGVDRSPPSNLVARRGGLVLEIHAFSGVKCVVPGMSVEEGQILLAGVEDTGTFGARTTAGLGEVTARTWHTLTTRVPLLAQRKVYTGEKQALSLIFGKKRIKFFPNSSIEGRRYDKITTRKQLSFLGIPLPVSVERETFRFYETQRLSLSASDAAARGEQALTQYLRAVVSPYGEICSTRTDLRTLGDTLEVTLRAECEEEIGVTVPIYMSP